MLQPQAQEAIFLSDHRSGSARSMYQYVLPALLLNNEWECLSLLELHDGCSVHCLAYLGPIAKKLFATSL